MALRKLVLLLLTAPLSQPSFVHHSRAENEMAYAAIEGFLKSQDLWPTD